MLRHGGHHHCRGRYCISLRSRGDGLPSCTSTWRKVDCRHGVMHGYWLCCVFFVRVNRAARSLSFRLARLTVMLHTLCDYQAGSSHQGCACWQLHYTSSRTKGLYKDLLDIFVQFDEDPCRELKNDDDWVQGLCDCQLKEKRCGNWHQDNDNDHCSG